MELKLGAKATLDSALIRDTIVRRIGQLIDEDNLLDANQVRILRLVKLRWAYLLDLDQLVDDVTKVIARKQ